MLKVRLQLYTGPARNVPDYPFYSKGATSRTQATTLELSLNKSDVKRVALLDYKSDDTSGLLLYNDAAASSAFDDCSNYPSAATLEHTATLKRTL